MSTIAISGRQLQTDRNETAARLAARNRTGVCAAGLALVLACALPPRLWGLNVPFESSDQASLVHMVLLNSGLRWILAHAYGPVWVVLEKAWVESALWMGVPLTESVFRGLSVTLDLTQVLITWPLMRRLACTRRQAFACMIGCAVLPAMVSNAHFTWNHIGVWLLTGTIALWATLAYFDDRKWWQLALAAGGLMAHCLSSAIAFGLPVVLVMFWIGRWRTRALDAHPIRAGTYAWECAAGLLIPCLAAISVIVGSWILTGEGQLGHLIAKFATGSGGWRIQQVLRIPGMWTNLFGYVFGLVAAAGLLRATAWSRMHSTADRRRLLALWAWSSLIPYVLIADWDRTGYAGAYLIEPAYCSTLLGMLLICELYGRLANRPALQTATAALALLAVGHLAFGTVDACLAGGRWVALTGVSAPWGSLRPDSGIKAAGLYVREHVPSDCVILCLHGNKGMELPLAEYYTGRRALADYDLKPAMREAILHAMGSSVDVIIVDAADQPLMESLPDFERVCTVRRESQPVRFVYSRRARGLPLVDAETAVLNRAYELRYRPTRVPVALITPPGFDGPSRTYRATLKQLRRAARAG